VSELEKFGALVFDAFQKTCDSCPEKTAIVSDGNEISFAQLEREAKSLASVLGDAVRSRVVGLQIESPIDFMIAYFALATCDAYLVLVDPRQTAEQRENLLADLAVNHVLVLSREQPSPEPGVRCLTEAGRDYCLCPTAVTLNPAARYEAGDFVVHTTSGSTGRPKGIAISAKAVMARVESQQKSIRLTADDTILCMLTLSHCHGIEVLMLPGLMTGCTVVAPSPPTITARRLVKLIEQHRVTYFSTLPWFYSLMNESMTPDKCDFSSVRMMISASAKIQRRVANEFKSKFGIQIHQAYGLAEISTICVDRDGLDDTLIGFPLELVEVKLASKDASTNEGELIARGPGLARGYINAPDDQAEMFRDGWLWSKDIVRREPNGFRLVGRLSSFINVGGDKVAPAMVEDVLMEYRNLRDVAVKGLEDPIEGERIVAFVILAADSDLDALKAHSRKRLPPHCQPREWVIVSELPRNSIGKILPANLTRPVSVGP